MRFTYIFLFIFILGLSACEEEETPMEPIGQLSIAETMLTDQAKYDLFIRTLTKAGLLNQLERSGNYTVFVPSETALNNYFTANGSLEELSGPRLHDDFAYHILRGIYTSNEFDNSGYLETLSLGAPKDNPLSFYYQKNSTQLNINNQATAQLSTTELSNGIMHTIDKVISPPRLLEIISFDPRFANLKQMVSQAGLDESLNLGGQFTLFAPCNEAFDALGDSINANIPQDLSNEEIQALLTYHTLPDTIILSNDFREGTITTPYTPDTNLPPRNILILEDSISFELMIEDYQDGKHQFKEQDIFASNGVLHAIDGVLLPGGF